MSPDNPFDWSPGKPELVLYPIPRSDASLDLIVSNVSQEMFSFLENDGPPMNRKVIGKPLPQLLAMDRQVVDEWMEFVVKIRANPSLANYDDQEEDRYTKTILQFYQLCMTWMLTTLTCDRASGFVLVTLSTAPEGQRQIGSWQWRELTHGNWLSRASAEGGYWDLDVDRQQIFLSKTLTVELRISNDAVVIPFQRFLDIVLPEDLPCVLSALEDISYGQITLFNRALLDDGSVLCFETRAIPFYSKALGRRRIIGITINTTQHEKAVEKLAVSERRFRNIIENATDIFILLDLRGVITYASPNVGEAVGMPPRMVVGKRFDNFLHMEENREHLLERYMQNLSVKQTKRVELRVRGANDKTVWLRVGMTSICNERGEVVEISAICRDVTLEKRQQQELLHMVSHDTLTGVYNRLYFEDELQRIDQEQLVNVGLIMVDLNGLKLINDAFSHREGDKLLIEAAELFSSVARGNLVARVGGDEFAIFLYNTTFEQVDKISKEILDACQRTQHRMIPLSVSCGIAFRESARSHSRELYEKAEERMFRNKLLESRSMHSQIILSLKEALKSHNLETADHMQRMEDMMVEMGRRLTLPSVEFDRLVLLASLHDIGKVAIPHSIISKPDRLSDDEWLVMRTHSEIGSRIVLSSHELSCISDEVCYHHERWDGRGYPHGKKGEEIPLLARIVSVVDTYDVMTNRRVYKEPISHRDAIAELERCAGSQFDPFIVEQFVSLFKSGSSCVFQIQRDSRQYS